MHLWGSLETIAAFLLFGIFAEYASENLMGDHFPLHMAVFAFKAILGFDQSPARGMTGGARCRYLAGKHPNLRHPRRVHVCFYLCFDPDQTVR